jgi:hypothetical protein
MFSPGSLALCIANGFDKAAVARGLFLPCKQSRVAMASFTNSPPSDNGWQGNAHFAERPPKTPAADKLISIADSGK